MEVTSDLGELLEKANLAGLPSVVSDNLKTIYVSALNEYYDKHPSSRLTARQCLDYHDAARLCAYTKANNALKMEIEQ